MGNTAVRQRSVRLSSQDMFSGDAGLPRLPSVQSSVPARMCESFGSPAYAKVKFAPSSVEATAVVTESAVPRRRRRRTSAKSNITVSCRHILSAEYCK